MKHRIGIVGARGYVGAELCALLESHPEMALTFAASRELRGEPLAASIPGTRSELLFSPAEPEVAARAEVDALVLALPNGKAGAYVEAIEAHAPRTVVVDLSADHRFDDAWAYGLPELRREHIRGARRIANPGCYATAMQLALAPLADVVVAPAQCFGVSGYSGAGTAPSDKNDVEKLRDNLMPYALVGHVHEREVTRQLGFEVEFMPHVASHFRGITMTVNAHLREATTAEAVTARYRRFYAGEPLVEIVEPAPWVSAIAGAPGCQIGGVTVGGGGRRVVVVATLDNLTKGAATQALQNLNLALGLPELAGIAPWGSREEERS